MEYCNIIDRLLTEFPELKYEYEENKDLVEDLPHLVYSIVFVPYICNICKDDVQEEKLKHISAFLEEMINYNKEIQEVIVLSVLESLISDREIINNLKKFLGEKTLKELNLLELMYGWDDVNKDVGL